MYLYNGDALRGFKANNDKKKLADTINLIKVPIYCGFVVGVYGRHPGDHTVS